MRITGPGFVDPIARRLREIAADNPELKNAARIYQTILPLLRDADLHVGRPSLTVLQALEKMQRGQPLLNNLDIDLDVASLRELMTKLARAVEISSRRMSGNMVLPWLSPSRADAGTAAKLIRLAIEKEKMDIASLLPHIFSGEYASVTSAAEGLQLDPGLVVALAHNALKPALRAWCRHLTPVADGFRWEEGYCFICGAAAALGELRDNEQVKHLRCGSCGADWHVSCLKCSLCGNVDHHTRRYLYEEGQGSKSRVEACDNCKGYLKVIASFSPTPVELLAAEDLATLRLDFIAQDRGYTRHVVRDKPDQA